MDQYQKPIRIIVNGKERNASRLAQNSYTHLKHIKSDTDYSFEEQKKRLPSNDFKKKRKQKSHVTKKASNAALKRVWISALSALCIGSTFGFFMLSIFTSEQSAIENVQGKESEIEQTAPASEDQELSLTVSVIQGGAFETAESANTAKEGFVQDGYAAIVDKEEKPYRLYIGIGTKKEHLNKLISDYDSYGQETYVKEIVVTPNEDISKEDKQTLFEGKQLLLAFMMDTERLFNGQEIKDRELLTEKLTNWRTGVEESQDDKGKHDFASSLQKTDQAIQDYMNDNSMEKLWEAENHILQAFMLYKQIVSR